jgi:hypothetical protein
MIFPLALFTFPRLRWYVDRANRQPVGRSPQTKGAGKMSEKISLETLLPVALDLYKSIPSVIVNIKPANEAERKDKVKAKADDFAYFTLYLQKKLSEQI